MSETRNLTPLQDRIRLVRLQIFFTNTIGTPIAFVGGGLITAFCLHRIGVPLNHLLVWYALVFLDSAAIFFFERYVRRIGLNLENCESLFRVRVALGVVVCALYGFTMVLLPEHTANEAYALLFILNSSIAAFAYMAYATVFFYGAMVNALTLLPYTGFCFYQYAISNDSFFLLNGAVALLWQFVIGRKAWKIAQSAVSEITARELLQDEIAKRKLVVEALQVNQDQSSRLASMLRMMCDHVPDMIWATDLEGRYTFVNKALCETLLNVEDTQEPLGKTFDFFAQRERDSHPGNPRWHTLSRLSRNASLHSFTRNEPAFYEISGYVRGQMVHFYVHEARFVNAHGTVIGTVGCARDHPPYVQEATSNSVLSV